MYKELIGAILAVLLCVFASIAVKKWRYKKYAILLMSIIYLAGLLYFTMIRGRNAELGGVKLGISFTIYKAIKARHYGLSTNRSVLNILLFVPAGLLLPQVSAYLLRIKTKFRFTNILKFAAISLLISLIIEGSQLAFRLGVFEVDDLIKNTLGGVIGYIIWTVIDHLE